MRRTYIITLLVLASLLGTACSEKLNSESEIIASTTTKNAFDRWLDQYYVDPYNIRFVYRYDEIETDYNYYTVPADYDCSVKMAHILKHVCLEAYDEVAGVKFTRTYFPKLVNCTGEWLYSNNGTMTLASAEGGRKINLQGLNHLPSLMTAENLNSYYLKTIHHEFTHILNQTKSYPTSFQTITGQYYVGGVWNESPYAYQYYYLAHGFVTAYSQQEHVEDFAEVLSLYLTTDDASWTTLMEQASYASAAYNEDNGTSLPDGAETINAKLDIVRNYMKASWGIDIDELHKVIQRRQTEIISGVVDLDDLTIE